MLLTVLVNITWTMPKKCPAPISGLTSFLSGSTRPCPQIFGIPWSPDEFLQQAALRKHPRDLVQLLPRDLSDVVECNSPGKDRDNSTLGI